MKWPLRLPKKLTRQQDLNLSSVIARTNFQWDYINGQKLPELGFNAYVAQGKTDPNVSSSQRNNPVNSVANT